MITGTIESTTDHRFVGMQLEFEPKDKVVVLPDGTDLFLDKVQPVSNGYVLSNSNYVIVLQLK